MLSLMRFLRALRPAVYYAGPWLGAQWALCQLFHRLHWFGPGPLWWPLGWPLAVVAAVLTGLGITVVLWDEPAPLSLVTERRRSYALQRRAIEADERAAREQAEYDAALANARKCRESPLLEKIGEARVRELESMTPAEYARRPAG